MFKRAVSTLKRSFSRIHTPIVAATYVGSNFWQSIGSIGAFPWQAAIGSLLRGKGIPKHLSNEKQHDCLGYIGDEIVASYVGVIMNHQTDSKGSILNNQCNGTYIRVFLWLI